MKNNFYYALMMLGKYSIYTYILGVILFSTAFAKDGKAQDILSVKDVRISLEMSKSSLLDIFKAIEAETDYFFVYDPEYFEFNKKDEINIHANDETLEKVLLDVSRQAKIGFRQVNNRISVKTAEKNWDRLEIILDQQTITGQVTDENGDGLPGATIQEKGTTNGTITDVNGDFSLNVTQDGVLTVSFVGYRTQEIPVNERTIIHVEMALDAEQLQEIVVIGYGTKKKNDLTGAVGSVASEEIQRRGTSNALEAIQGQLPGVSISRSSGRANVGYDIVIRGQNSISAGSPLYVVDGLIVDNIDFLNPNDIEQLDILKDASSTAIYGSRGSNGVVIITTKGAGRATEKISVSYDAYYGVKTPAHLPRMMNAGEWLNYRIAAAQGNNPDPFSGDVFGSTNEVRPVSGEEWDREMQRRIEAGETYNWPEKFMENGLITNHHLTFRGMTGNTAIGMTAGYQKEKGFIEKDYLDRFTFSLDVNHNFNETWEVGGQFRAGLRETEVAGGKSILNYYRMPPLALAEDPTGWLYDDQGLTILPARWSTGAINPLLDQKYSNNQERSIDLLGKIYFNYSPTDWLSVRTDFMPRFRWSRDGSYSGLYSEDAKGTQSETNAEVQNQHRLNYIWDNQVNAQKSFGRHRIQGTGVFSLYDFQEENFAYEVRDLPQNTSFYNMGTAGERALSESMFTMNRLVSFMGRFNYDYADKYLFTVSARWDGSSKLGEGHKWAAFPSAALGWKINEESFLSEVGAITLLKIRASYGFTGNNNISAFQSNVSANRLHYYDFGGQISNGIGPSGIANNALTWEKTRELNLGLDFGFFNGRVSGTVDAYSKLSSNLLMDRKLPVPMGWDEMTDNIGSVRNEGIEIALRTVNIQTSNLTWETSFMFSKNNNSVVETNLGKVDDVVNGLFIGQPVNVHYNYDMIGIWQLDEAQEAENWGREPGMPKIRDISGPEGGPDGRIDAQYDRTIIGKPIPDFIGSFYTRLQYRSFDISMSVYTEQGIMKRSDFFNDLIYTSRNTVLHNYWTTTNPSNEAPSPAFLDDPYWGRKGARLQNYRETSFTRIQNITVGFTVPKQVLEKIKLSRLRVYTNVTNPVLITPFEGHDPEFGDEGANDGPSFMTMQLGVNVSF